MERWRELEGGGELLLLLLLLLPLHPMQVSLFCCRFIVKHARPEPVVDDFTTDYVSFLSSRVVLGIRIISLVL